MTAAFEVHTNSVAGAFPDAVTEAIVRDEYALREEKNELTLGEILGRVIDANRAIGEAYDRAATLVHRRGLLHRKVYEAIGGDELLAKGQKTKRVRDGDRTYVVEIGLRETAYCANHAAPIAECATLHDASVPVWRIYREPSLSVREASTSAEDAA